MVGVAVIIVVAVIFRCDMVMKIFSMIVMLDWMTITMKKQLEDHIGTFRNSFACFHLDINGVCIFSIIIVVILWQLFLLLHILLILWGSILIRLCVI